ncbi:dipeptide ABC transporter ATP-binding protein [Brevibacillus centrosporus]|uniref:ABC transporter ATP-binding protein n=1 Tax=Brevibacillus centrosporus TaxID=54910 RepID=UPI003D1DCB26
MALDTAPLLEVKGLKKYYPFKKGMFSSEVGYVRAVDGLDFTVQQGETLGIVGESGCGKSTVGQLILQLLEPTEGEIWFQGKDVSTFGKSELKQARRNLQMIFQDPYSSLNPRMRVEDIVGEPLKIFERYSKKERREKVVELLRLVGLDTHHLSRHPHEFSGGQRQRIGIARALALNPKIIVCDEAVSALDVSIQSQILNLLRKLQNELGLTYIFIAHGLPAVKHISDRIAVMYLGRIVELADRDTLFASPKHPYTKALLSAVPIPDPLLRKERIILQGDLPNPAAPPSGCHFHTRCPYAQPVCETKSPELMAYGGGQVAACHFPLEAE